MTRDTQAMLSMMLKSYYDRGPVTEDELHHIRYLFSSGQMSVGEIGKRFRLSDRALNALLDREGDAISTAKGAETAPRHCANSHGIGENAGT